MLYYFFKKQIFALKPSDTKIQRYDSKIIYECRYVPSSAHSWENRVEVMDSDPLIVEMNKGRPRQWT